MSRGGSSLYRNPHIKRSPDSPACFFLVVLEARYPPPPPNPYQRSQEAVGANNVPPSSLNELGISVPPDPEPSRPLATFIRQPRSGEKTSAIDTRWVPNGHGSPGSADRGFLADPPRGRGEVQPPAIKWWGRWSAGGGAKGREGGSRGLEEGLRAGFQFAVRCFA